MDEEEDVNFPMVGVPGSGPEFRVELVDLSRSPGMIFTGLVGATAALSLYAASVPGGVSVVSGLAGFSWFVLGVTWVVRALSGRGLPASERRGRLFAPVVLAVTMGLLITGVPLKTRLALSADALLDYGMTHSRAGVVVRENVRVGLYNVSRVQPVREGVMLRTRNGEWTDEGFGWFPHGVPLTHSAVYEHVYGDWYTWRR